MHSKTASDGMCLEVLTISQKQGSCVSYLQHLTQIFANCKTDDLYLSSCVSSLPGYEILASLFHSGIYVPQELARFPY